jgi:hypothetical protein
MRITGIARLMLLGIAILALSFGLAAQSRQLNLSAAPNSVFPSNQNELGFEVRYSVSDLKINEVQTREGAFDELSIEGYGFTRDLGQPKLPLMRKIIAVPIGAEVTWTVTARTERELPAADNRLKNRIVPAQESVSKSEDPALKPFLFDREAYARDGFNTRDWLQATEIGFMRGVRIFALDFHPVRYDPVSGALKVMQDYAVQVRFDHPDLAATAELMARTASHEFDSLYGKTIFNWPEPDRTSIVRHPTKMLILTPANYYTTLQPFINWKLQQGLNLVVTTVGTGGTVSNTTSAIQTYMNSVWSSATAGDPAPTYLLIVGDTSTSGDNIIANTGVTSSSHVTDLTYVRLQGSDYVPEMYYGRFSVSSATELSNVINKTLMFEQTTFPDPSYLGQTVLIAGVDGTYAATHGNGQINYGSTYYFNAGNGITSNNYLYPASGSSDAQIIANANAGRGFINYTAHGSQTSWADPTMTTSDLNGMTNTNKPFVAVGNCCLTNAFNYYSPCFGEVMIRAANKAGVAYIGGTNNTYWDEDYWWGVGAKGTATGSAPAYNASTLGAYDAMFHTHGEAFTDWAQTLGETIWMGNLAVTQGGSSRTNYYWEIYSIMGDPSLMPYYGVPSANGATYPSQILLGATSINVTAQPYSRVALSMGGVLYGTAIVPVSGSLALDITPFTHTGTAQLVITAQNRITVISDLNVIPNSGAYLNVSAATYADANNNSPEYNETGRFNVTFQNVGSEAANDITATLTCSAAGITITDETESIATLAGGTSVAVNNAYSFNIADNIANGSSAQFTITMVSGSDSWTHSFTLDLYAPSLAIGSMTVQDPAGNNNGRLDPGETVTIVMPLANNGGAASPAGTASLASPTTGITVNSGSASFNPISAGGSASLVFSATASSSLPVGASASFVFTATAGAYSAGKTETTAVGVILEDFETGSFNSFPWTFSGNANWTIDNTTSQTGTYSTRSGTISHSQTTTMQTIRILSASGNISFWYRVSSESGYDYLRFYIDGVQQAQWSGTVDWAQANYAVSAGTKTLAWTYYKDYSVSTGSDCAWVDNIIFPPSTAPNPYNPPRNLAAAPGNWVVNLSWQAPASGTPVGYKIFRDASLLTTVTGLSFSDTAVVNGTAYSYYLTAVYGGGESDPSNTVAATPTANPVVEVVLGSGTSTTSTTTAAPVNVYFQSLHGQSVYTAAELNAAGIYGPVNIRQVGFNITGLPSLAMPSFIVRMGHTSAANVSSWIQSNLDTVFSTASYQPTATGYNMLTLTTPYVWNGTDNLVIDTAFGLIGSYTSTGTVQYTAMTNGYRYVRSDTINQTSVFSGGSTSTTRPNVKLAVQSLQTGPLISADPVLLDFGTVEAGSSSTLQFTLYNDGDETLTGTITPPAAYLVSNASRETGSRDPGPIRTDHSFSIPAGESAAFNLTFEPSEAIVYDGNLVIASNASDYPNLLVALMGNGSDPNANHPPAIDLPASFEFDRNGSLEVCVACYTADYDGDILTLSWSGNDHIIINEEYLTVTFTAEPNWTGSETVTFTVSDGTAQASDIVVVTVNPVNVPSWTPVVYPTNPATIYGVVTIAGVPAALNDMVGAFSGTECRGIGEVVTNSGSAYVTLLVNLSGARETIGLKVYSYAQDEVYDVAETFDLGFGEVLGETDPVPINGLQVTALDTPQVSLQMVSEGCLLQWQPVDNATEYYVYRSADPLDGFVQVGTVTACEYLDGGVGNAAFYFVKAVYSTRGR